MTQSHDDAVARAARLLAGALSELQTAAARDAGISSEEMSRSRAAIEAMVGRIEEQLAEDRQQRATLAAQLGNLGGSLDRLVTHLEGLSQLMTELLERFAEPTAQPAPGEPMFQPGGEGVALTLVAVPGFQALMDIQKALIALDQVASASVERFQEGDSRIQLQLRAACTGAELAAALSHSTGHALVVEEARPELMRLRLKVVG